ncbi:MAG: hypothetical protein AAB250_06090, partial [Bdellovibrionota bacterium]
NAREGTDFELHGEIVLVHNKRALKVIPEDMKTSLIGLLRLIEGIDASDRGVLEKIRRRISNQRNTVSAKEMAEVRALLFARDLERSKQSRDPVLGEWLEMPLAMDHLDILAALLKRGYYVDQIAFEFISEHDTEKMRPLLELAVTNADVKSSKIIFDEILEKGFWKNDARYGDWIRVLAGRGVEDAVKKFFELADPKRDAALLNEIHLATKKHDWALACILRPEWQTVSSFATALDFMLKDGIDTTSLSKALTQRRLSPPARSIAGERIERYLNEYSTYSNERIKERFQLYVALESAKPNTLSSERLAKSLKERLTRELAAAANGKLAVDLTKVVAVFGNPPLATIIETFERTSASDSFYRFAETFNKFQLLTKASVARSFLQVYFKMSVPERFDEILTRETTAWAVLDAAMTLGTSKAIAREALFDLRAASPLHRTEWSNQIGTRDFFAPVDPVAEAKRRVEYFVDRSAHPSMLKTVEQQRATPNARIYRELSNHEITEIYFDGLLKLANATEQDQQTKRVELAATLSYSPAVFDPEKRRRLSEALRTTTSHISRRRMVETFDAPSFNYRRFIDLAGFDSPADAIIMLGEWPKFDLAEFRKAFTEFRDGNPWQADGAFFHLAIWLAQRDRYAVDYHDFLKE